MIKKIKTLIYQDHLISNQVRKNNHIVYGARAMNKQLLQPFRRKTNDWDIFSNTPRKSSMQLKTVLNRNAGTRHYYNKPALFKGTYKVKSVGDDGVKGTEDDKEVADYSKIPRGAKTITSDGIKYIKMNNIVKDRYKSLRDKESKFRHAKDRADLDRIRTSSFVRSALYRR